MILPSLTAEIYVLVLPSLTAEIYAQVFAVTDGSILCSSFCRH